MSNLFSDREAEAIELMKQYEPAKGYFLSFSGGKDSAVLDAIAQRAGVKYDRHFANTTVEAPETYRFIAKEYPGTIWDKPLMTMRQAIVTHRMPPTRKVRYCCEALKECHGSGRLILTGIRKKESTARNKRKQIEVDFNNNSKIFINPILHWTTEEIWDYTKENGLPVNPLYAEGRKRIGCVMCPMGDNVGMTRDMKRWPAIANRYRLYFQEMLDNWKAQGRPLERWKTGDEIFEWWIANERNGSKKQKSDLFAEAVGCSPAKI